MKCEFDRIQRAFLALSVLFMGSTLCHSQPEIKLEPATVTVLGAFRSRDIVMLGEGHGNKQEYEWLRSLIATSEFADRVDEIVMEFGKSLYQESVDRQHQITQELYRFELRAKRGNDAKARFVAQEDKGYDDISDISFSKTGRLSSSCGEGKTYHERSRTQQSNSSKLQRTIRL